MEMAGVPGLPPPTVRLGLVGGRGAGKTSLLASLPSIAAHRAGGCVSLPDPGTRALLARWWTALQEGDVPAATAAKDHFPDLRFRLAHADAEWNVVVHDYAGGLLEVLDGMEGDDGSEAGVSSALRGKVGGLLSACDAALFFLPVDLEAERGRSAARAYRLVLDAALEYFREDNGAVRRTRPFCLALAKWDLVADRFADAASYLEQTPDLAHCAALVRQGRAAFAVLPVSSFGRHDEGDSRRPPADGPEPLNVFEALHWLCRETTEGRARRAREELSLLRPRLGLFARHGAAEKLCGSAIGAVAEPEARKEFADRLTRIRRARERRRWLGGAGLLLLAAAGAAGWSWQRTTTAAQAYPADADGLSTFDWAAAERRLSDPWVRWAAAAGLPWATALERLHGEKGQALLAHLDRRAAEPADRPDADDELRLAWSRTREERLGLALPRAAEGSEWQRRWRAELARESALRRELAADEAFRAAAGALNILPDGEFPAALAAFRLRYPPERHPRQGKAFSALAERLAACRRAVDEAEAAAVGAWPDAPELSPARRVDYARRRLAVRESFAERRRSGGLGAGDGAARQEAERQLIGHWTPYVGFDADLAALNRDDPETLAAFLEDHPGDRYPERAALLAELSAAAGQLEHRRLSAKAEAAAASASAYWREHPAAYRNALDRFSAARELALKASAAAGGDGGPEASALRAKAETGLAEIRSAWRKEALGSVKAALEGLRPETLAAAADACGAFLALPDGVRGDGAGVKAWAEYLRALGGPLPATVSLSLVDLEGSPFSRWVGDCRMAVTVEQDGQAARFAGAAAGTRAGEGITFFGEDTGYFAMGRNRVKPEGWSKPLALRAGANLKVTVSEGDRRGTATFGIFDAVSGLETGSTRLERSVAVLQDGTDANPARIGLVFTGLPPRPERLP